MHPNLPQSFSRLFYTLGHTHIDVGLSPHYADLIRALHLPPHLIPSRLGHPDKLHKLVELVNPTLHLEDEEVEKAQRCGIE